MMKAQYKADLQKKKPQELDEEAQMHGVHYTQGALNLFPLARDELTTKLLEHMDKHKSCSSHGREGYHGWVPQNHAQGIT